MVTYEGKCSSCNKTHYSPSKHAIIVCDCYQRCPICNAPMMPYTPDLTMNTYGLDDKHDLEVIMVCTQHNPPFFSTKKPIEVICI